MAAETNSAALDVAEGVEEVCNELIRFKHRLDRILAFNSNASVDWSNGELSNATPVDLSSKDYTSAHVSNAIGTLASLKTAMDGVLDSGNLGNVDQIARPFG